MDARVPYHIVLLRALEFRGRKKKEVRKPPDEEYYYDYKTFMKYKDDGLGHDKWVESEMRIDPDQGSPQYRMNFLDDDKWARAQTYAQGDDVSEQLCICGTESYKYKTYIQCDECKRWYHPQCMGMTEKQADELEEFVCKMCARKKTDVDIALEEAIKAITSNRDKPLETTRNHKRERQLGTFRERTVAIGMAAAKPHLIGPKATMAKTIAEQAFDSVYPDYSVQ